MRNIATSKLSYKKMLDILDEIELRWCTTKEACDYCIPDELLEWGKQVRLLILQKIPTKKVKAKDVDKETAYAMCKQFIKLECCEHCPLLVKNGLEIFGRKIDICLKNEKFMMREDRLDDLLEREVKEWKDE